MSVTARATVTVTDAFHVRFSVLSVAVIVDCPFVSPVTTPFSSTVAMFSRPLTNVNSPSAAQLPCRMSDNSSVLPSKTVKFVFSN